MGAGAGGRFVSTRPTITHLETHTMPVDFGADEGEEFSPLERAHKPAVQLPPNRPFHLASHPKRWDVMDGRVLPSLGVISHVDGLNGQTRGNFRQALADAEKRGWTPIPHDVDKKKGVKSYVRRHLVENNGQASYVHLDRWTQCFPGTSTVRSRSAEYYDWLQSLIDRGIVPLPPIYRAEALLEERRALAEAYAKRAAGNPVLQERYATVFKEAKAVEDFLQKHFLSASSEGESFVPEVPSEAKADDEKKVDANADKITTPKDKKGAA